MAATLAACHAIFHPGPDGWASGNEEPESIVSAGAMGSLACAPPQVDACGEAAARPLAAPPGGARLPSPGHVE
jgi:hypothetical protein